MRVALAGSGVLAASLMQPILQSGHELVALVQNGRATQGFQRWLHPFMGRIFGGTLSVTGQARRRGIPIVWIDKMTPDELAPLRECAPELLLVGGFSIILKPPILNLPSIGCVNTHSSLLPRHRGPNPFTAAILAGDEETGVTFHVMDEGIDTGAILEQHRLPIREDDTAGALYKRAAALAGDHIVALLDRIETEGRLAGEPQPTEGATYEKLPKPEDTFLDWIEPAEQLHRKVRALYPLMRAKFLFRGHVVSVLRATYDDSPVDAPPGTVLVNRPRVSIATGRGTLHIVNAYTLFPMPSRWPSFFGRPEVGEVLE